MRVRTKIIKNVSRIATRKFTNARRTISVTSRIIAIPGNSWTFKQFFDHHNNNAQGG